MDHCISGRNSGYVKVAGKVQQVSFTLVRHLNLYTYVGDSVC